MSNSSSPTENNPTLIIGEAVFVASKAAVVDSLFRPVNGRTASGFYKTRKTGVAFHKADGALFAFLVCNRHGERFFVSASTDSGRPRYMFSTSTPDEERLGIAGLGWTAQHDEAARIATQLGFN